MHKVEEGFKKIVSDIAEASHILTAEEKKAKIAEILLGFTDDEVKQLSEKTQQLETASWGGPNGTQEANLMEVAQHMLTHPRQAPATIDVGNIPSLPTPADPATNPGAIRQEEEPDFGNPVTKGKKNIFTRGQKITNDKHDYENDYPQDGSMLGEKQVAMHILSGNMPISNADKDIIRSMQEQGASFDQIAEHLTTRIVAQRREVEGKKQEWHYDAVLQDCYKYIPQYLQDKSGLSTSNGLNQLPDTKRIHIVGDYDFMHITGGRAGALGVFRSTSGDIYVSHSYLAQFEKYPPLGQNDHGVFPRLHREMKTILVHELLHSMSVLNYVGKEDKSNVNTRRIGLRHISYARGASKGVGVNEGTTERLSQNIVQYLYEQEGLLSYTAPWTSYPKEQQIIDSLVNNKDIDVTWEDFYKGMLLRKKVGVMGPDNIGPTPLVDLIRKVNGGREINNQERPYFFDIMMYLMDYVNENKVNIDFILEFIEKKDISIIEQQLGSTLSTVIPDHTLLNAHKTGFNETIVNAYTIT